MPPPPPKCLLAYHPGPVVPQASFLGCLVLSWAPSIVLAWVCMFRHCRCWCCCGIGGVVGLVARCGVWCVGGADECDAIDDALIATQRVLARVKVKLAFASHILESASKAPRLCEQTYCPLSLPHRPPEAMQTTFGLSSSQLCLFLFATTVNDESLLYDAQKSAQIAEHAKLQQTPLWILAFSEPDPPPIPFPPSFLACFVLCVIEAVNVWYHAVALYHHIHEPLQPIWHDIRDVPPDAAHYLAISIDNPSYYAPANAHTWFLHPMSHKPPQANMKLFCAADFQGMRWGLYGTGQATESLSFTQLLCPHCFFRAHRSGFSSL